LTQVHLFLDHVVGLVDLYGQLSEPESVGTEVLVPGFGRDVAEEIDLGLSHIEKAFLEHPGED